SGRRAGGPLRLRQRRRGRRGAADALPALAPSRGAGGPLDRGDPGQRRGDPVARETARGRPTGTRRGGRAGARDPRLGGGGLDGACSDGGGGAWPPRGSWEGRVS